MCHMSTTPTLPGQGTPAEERSPNDAMEHIRCWPFWVSRTPVHCSRWLLLWVYWSAEAWNGHTQYISHWGNGQNLCRAWNTGQSDTDNGPQLASYAFSKFAYQWKFLWVSSSPTYAQFNGMAERAVQTAKNIITKCMEDGSNIHLAFLNLRNTPRDGITGSPAQRLFGRRTRTRLPTTTALLKPKTELPE